MKKVVFTALLLTAASAIWGQSNAMLDEFLEGERADAATALLLIGQASGQLGPEAAPADGYAWAADQAFAKYLEGVASDDPISLGLFYLALFDAFDVEGGLMYNAVGSPRYAAMEAGYLGYVEPSRLYFTRSMEPYEVLTGITYVSEDTEGGEK